MFGDEGIWLGSMDAHRFALNASSQAVQLLMSGQSSKDGLPEILSVNDGVGVVSIRGPLVSGSAGFMAYFGVTGYNDIRTALVAAVNHPDVSAIVLDINSGGGAVAGVADTANFISQVDALKPVVTYADGMMGSGAYWLGSSARKVLISQTTIAGSIGVIMTHTEASRMRDQAGITDTVIRAGEYKALGGPYEPLSEKAKAQYQAQADQIMQVFTSHVASRRKVSYAKADAQMGQGREFVGEQAVTAGLVDKTGTFEDAIAMAKSLVPVDRNKGTSQTSRQFQGAIEMSKTTLTAQQIALIASGGSLETAVKTPEELAAEETARVAAEAETTRLAALAAAGGAAKTPEELAAEAAAATAAAAAAAAAGTTPAAKTESELTIFLRSELAAAQTKTTEQAVQLAALQAQVDTTKDTHGALLDIARAAVGNMNVALGGNAEGAKTFTDVQVVTEHARVLAIFTKKLPIGGVAASSVTDTEKQVKTAVVHPLFKALVPLSKNA